MGYDIDAQLVPGVAERFEIREDGATFWLREDTLGDGVPVTARDFVFSWKRVLDRKPLHSMRLFFTLLRTLRRKPRGNAGCHAGFRAASDRRLEVDFERPPLLRQAGGLSDLFPGA